MSDQENQIPATPDPAEVITTPDAQATPAPAAPADDVAAPATEATTDDVIDEVAQEPWPGLPPMPDSKNVVLTDEIFSPITEAQAAALPAEMLYLPSETAERMEEYANGRPNEESGITNAEVIWERALELAEMVRPRDNRFAASVEKEGSAWRQAVDSEGGGKLSPARPRIKDPADGVVTGARAVQRIRSILGLGSLLQVPLWHSGFWITLRAPSEGELLELHRRIADAKVTLGRQTYGLVFANTSAYVAAELVQFVLEHLHDTTLKQGTDLRKYLKVHDLQTLAWGMACVIYTKGFQYSRPVLVGEGEEKKEVKGLLNVGKMFFTDTAALTPWQISHMAKRAGNTMSAEMLERYQSEFTNRERQVELVPGLKMTMKVPSIDEYINSGHRWVEGITDMVDRAFQQPPEAEIRDRYITQQGRATSMRQFAHWVKSVDEDGEGGMSYEDPDTLEQLLNTLSEDDQVRDKYFKAIKDFTDDTTISVVATPAVNEKEENRLPRFPRLVPIDALYTFFILLVQKTEKVNQRQDI